MLLMRNKTFDYCDRVSLFIFDRLGWGRASLARFCELYSQRIETSTIIPYLCEVFHLNQLNYLRGNTKEFRKSLCNIFLEQETYC